MVAHTDLHEASSDPGELVHHLHMVEDDEWGARWSSSPPSNVA